MEINEGAGLKIPENSCKQCGTIFPNQHDLRKHIDVKHVVSEPTKRKRRNSDIGT